MGKRGNGEGSIRKRQDGRWEGRYTAGVDPATGKQVQRSVYGTTRKECAERLREKMDQAENGLYIASDKLLLSEWLHVYLWEIKRARLKQGTFAQYVYDVNTYVKGSELAAMKIKDVRRFHIQAFVDALGAARSAFVVRNVYGIIRNAFAEAEKRGAISVSYAMGVSLPQRKPKPTAILSIIDQRRFMDAVKGDRLEAAFIVALTTGIREGELAALAWPDYEEGCISISKDVVRAALYDPQTGEKTGSKIIVQDTPKTAAGVRRIPLLPVTVEALRAHRMKQNDERMKNRLLYADTGLIFCNEIGGIYEPAYYRKQMQKIMGHAGIPKIKFHALRHSFATRGLEAGVSPRALQGLLGHETPEMVMQYQHLLEQQARAEIDKLKDFF
jgi:integrase